MRRFSKTSRAGTSWSDETQIQVQWAWLTLPCCFTLFSLLFFIATVIHQRFSKTYVWKSSSDAMLYALNHESRHAHGIMVGTSEMERRTKALLARLQHDPGRGWQLVTKERKPATSTPSGLGSSSTGASPQQVPISQQTWMPPQSQTSQQPQPTQQTPSPRQSPPVLPAQDAASQPQTPQQPPQLPQIQRGTWSLRSISR